MTLPHKQWFRFARYKLRLSQRVLADKLSITPSAVSRIENGDRRPGEPVWLALAQLLGVTLDDYAKGPPA